VKIPAQPRRRAILPIAIGVGVLAAFAGIFVLVRSSRSTTAPPPDVGVAVVTPVSVDAAALDASVAIVVADASIDAAPKTQRDTRVTPVEARPGSRAEATSPKLATTPTKPQVVNMDLGAAKTDLTLASTLERAKVIARMLPNVTSARLIEIRVGGVDGDVVDATRGGWVSYRLAIDPPPNEGCHAIVRFGSTTTVHVERAYCAAESLSRLPTCSFAKAWQSMLGVRADHKFKLNYIKIEGGGAFWEAHDNYRSDRDDCK
jgi:hypothetical protein